MRGVLGLASVVAALSLSVGGPANAGTVQYHPLDYLSQIFNQQSVLNATGGRGINVQVYAPRTIYAHASNISSLTELMQQSGLANSLTIPVFYIDSYKVPGQVGLGYFGDNGVTVLTSYQETLALRPQSYDYATCTADHGYTCFYTTPAVTQADIPLGWLSSASVIAHEIGHNLGLDHVPMGAFYTPTNLMNPSVTHYDQILSNPAFDTLTDAQVQTMLQSPFLRNFEGQRYLQIVPFSVLSVPEPSAWALMIGGFALAGLGLRRRRVAAAA